MDFAVKSPVDSKSCAMLGLFMGRFSSYKFHKYCLAVRLTVHETKIMFCQSTCFGLGAEVEVVVGFGKFIVVLVL